MESDAEELIIRLENKASELEQRAANEGRRWDRAEEIERWEVQALLLRSEAMRLRLGLENRNFS